jgi:hypothetical protein
MESVLARVCVEYTTIFYAEGEGPGGKGTCRPYVDGLWLVALSGYNTKGEKASSFGHLI